MYPRYSSTYCGPVPLYYETGVDAGGGYAGVTGVARPDVCPPSEIIGYTVEQGVEVKVRDFAKVGDILAGVVENGANSTSQLYFTISARQWTTKCRERTLKSAGIFLKNSILMKKNRNSIKESISAVESACNIINNNTLLFP